MSRRPFIGSLTATLIAVLAFAAVAMAAPPVVNVHVNFTSDPYADNWCGIDGSSVDSVVAHYKEDAGGAFIANLNLTISFTATASGKSMQVHIARVGKATAPIDNGDGTATVLTTTNGVQSFKLQNGPLFVRSAGNITFAVTFDAVTGDFISFEVVEEHGQFPPGCDQIVVALT